MLNILLTIVVPVIILTRFSDDDQLGPVRGFILAMAFPLIYGVTEWFRKRKFGFAAGLGILSVVLTGGIGLFELDPKWVAYKEASIPLAFALAILASRWTRFSLVQTIIDKILDGPRVREALAERGTTERFQRRTVYATYLLAGTFFLSAALNFTLATLIVNSEPGSAEFNDELGRMTALSYPVITVPVLIMMFVTILFILLSTTRLTGLSMENVMRQSGSQS